MTSLYAVSINGTMLYVTGNLSEQNCIDIDIIAENFQTPIHTPIDYDGICQTFISMVQDTLHISLTQIPLKKVFRIY